MSHSPIPSMLLACLALAAPSLLSAQPASVVDARQAVVDSTIGGLIIGGASDQRLAQTLTIGLDGRLSALFLPVACDSGDLVVEIRDVVAGEPGPGVLASQRIRAAALPLRTPSALVEIALRGGPEVVAGQSLAVVLDNPTGACGLFQGPPGDPYPAGMAFFEALPNPPGWLPLASSGRDDLAFLVELRVR